MSCFRDLTSQALRAACFISFAVAGAIKDLKIACAKSVSQQKSRFQASLSDFLVSFLCLSALSNL
jgi:hypothetical protein